ncbi:MAG: PAS domain-containing sensor histidine kinase [Bacteroidota bacterium]
MKEKLLQFENEAGFRALFDHATVGIIVVDQDGYIVLANPITQRLFGYENHELEGQKVEVLIPQKFRDGHVGFRTHYNRNPRPREMGSGQDLYAAKKDGTIFPVEISLSSYEIVDDRVMVAFITDITQQKNYTQRLQKQVDERTEQLESALKNEKALSELKSKFISIASHEFRTPLSTILSSASLIDKYIDKGDIEAQKKHIGRIRSSVKNLNGILTDFLSLEKLEEGMVVNNPAPLLLGNFLNEIIEELEGTLKTGQTILVSKDIDTDEVCMDRNLLRAVLTNLISNASKYSAQEKKIELIIKQSETLEIVVKDYGIGIPENDQKNIFSRFFRASNVSGIKGTGLGLNIIKRYVEIMDGVISFESHYNEGSTFFVRVPCQG